MEALEESGDMRRIRYLRGVRVDAWVSSRDLDEGLGFDCDDCDGEGIGR
ncbi:hypothetical protein AKJ09_04833 [Labilithrix luteola]|uniref:Uncharacterized protein n=1 Tax=Labilithrix luteola TaxID=1391654 RepID=A0A0K1PYE8_9BACT|nr:hypothetical protein AKJ09_04833 [Labilithrix luteola]